ncbi:MAG: glycosyltransferase [Clostridia bacterium]|nr:glycosyltransferase [Clostridia bacterium]
MRLLQVNACYPDGSTGAVTRDIYHRLIAEGHEAYIASPLFRVPREKNFYAIGAPFSKKIHALGQRITGYQSHGSHRATDKLCRYIDSIAPDIVHLHNVHSHYLNFPILLNHIVRRDIALCLTLHDCWFFTGGCVHYTQAGCAKWRTGCGGCPKGYYGIKTWFFDRSAEMARERRDLFACVRRLGVIGVSDWVLGEAKNSFIFRDHPAVRWTHIGINADSGIFKPSDPAGLRRQLRIPPGCKMILGVASPWTRRKGLETFIALAPLLNGNERIVLAGPKPKQPLPANITAVGRIADPETLAAYYSAADVFLQASKEETFGKVTLESLLCGTPAAAFDVTGNTDLIKAGCAEPVPPEADPQQILAILRRITAQPKDPDRIRASAETRFSRERSLAAHLEFYKSLL